MENFKQNIHEIEVDFINLWFKVFGTPSEPKKVHFLDIVAMRSLVKNIQREHKPLKGTVRKLLNGLTEEQRNQLKL